LRRSKGISMYSPSGAARRPLLSLHGGMFKREAVRPQIIQPLRHPHTRNQRTWQAPHRRNHHQCNRLPPRCNPLAHRRYNHQAAALLEGAINRDTALNQGECRQLRLQPAAEPLPHLVEEPCL
jgi:hypothetical protein